MDSNQMIFEELLKLKENSYSPYSNFKVACLIYLQDGQVIKGINVENASYPATICAERTALSQVYALGYKKADIKSLELYTDSEILGSPCGVCRQFISELIDWSTPISIYSKKGFQIKTNIKELLPYAFEPEQILK
ncbi:cytidine deaminase [Mesoplasma melaleucae]|uniref:Cytidine deaminase n=1 Tax=Mesoplasma melaleucae TaxID=81459 RepID=A0A2K8NYC1_9MOLU|nr:cytidine deaminase [Mesoplasma melaleucae]ATZ17751.1 cytidine deaminase [Mesoplasma melaleucae]